MTSTRRHDVFTKNTNPLYKIYMPTNPDHEPPQYFPRQGRRQIYDFLQSKVNVHMKFGKYSSHLHFQPSSCMFPHAPDLFLHYTI